VKVALAVGIVPVTATDTETPWGADFASKGQHWEGAPATRKLVLSELSQFADNTPAENTSCTLTSQLPAASGSGTVAGVPVAVVQLPVLVLAFALVVVN